MKFRMSVVAISLLTVSSITTVEASQTDVSALSGICENVKSDNKNRFRKKIKESGLKLRNVYGSISCGGKNLVRYAMSSEANSVGSFIVKRMPASHFASSGDLEWASSNGFNASPIAESIATR